ncbi:phage tail tape measure protein [Moraxella nasibovis]|uniref:phage tail tape measure protein n=1 Tax=Moraxella nasibovis TaxID=2904120 RepID=UPI00240FC44D|nr:phage tail tape measure protein [Moraxella nasibovis]WFF39596.1 phage tail tape measure protein [Moraxella nasibovis]
MASDLVVALTITAALGAGFHAAFSQAEKVGKKLGDGLKQASKDNFKLGEQIEKMTKKQSGLLEKINSSGGASQRKLDGMYRRYSQMGTAIAKLKQKQEQYTNAISKSEKAQKNLNDAINRRDSLRAQRDATKSDLMDSAATTMAIAAPIGKAVKTFMEGEDAAANLKIAMMKADGTFGEFDKISKIADELGNTLPGTSKDFYALAQSLKQQGLSDQALTGGAFKTAAELNVLFDMDQATGGEFLAKFMESHGLKEHELGAAADALQRARYASGLDPRQMLDAMKYYAPTANTLGLTGLDNTKKILAMETMAAKKGMEGSVFGMAFEDFMGMLSKGPKMIESAKKGMKAESRRMLEESGVKMEFYDEKGTLKSIDNIMTELDKLEKVREKFGDEGVLAVTKDLFGDSGGRLAAILSENGKEGLAKTLKEMEEQASLQERINVKTRTLSSILESLQGVWSTAVGAFGEAFADDIKSASKWAMDFIDNSITPWIKENQTLVKTISLVVLGISAVATAGLALKFVFLGLAAAINTVLMPFKIFKAAKAAHELAVLNGKTTLLTRAVGMLKGAFAWLKGLSFGKLFGFLKSIPLNPLKALPMLFGAAKGAIFGIVGALKAFTMAALTSPITWLVVGALLLYKFWNPIKAFFAGIWDSISAAAAPIMPIFSAIGNAIKPALDWLGQFFNLTQVGEGNVRSLGQTVGGFLVGAFMALTAPIRTVWQVAKFVWDSLTGLFSGEISVGDIFGGFSRAWEGFLTKIEGWKAKASELWNSFTSLFKGGGDKAVGGAVGGAGGGGFWSSLTSGLESARQTISEKAGGLWDSAKAKFDEAKGTLTTKASEIWSSVTNVLNGANGVNIGAIIAQTVSGAVSAISGAATTISGVLSAMVQGMSGAFVAIFPVISTAFSGMAAVASAGVASLTAVVMAGFAVMRVQVASGWQSLGAAMSGNPMLVRLQMAMGQCIAYLGGVQGRFYAIGLNISQGLARGIESGIGRVRAATVKLAQEVDKTTRLQMKIKSPSRVMMALGGFVSAGLAVGIAKGGSKPIQAIGRVAKGVTAGLGEKMGDLSAVVSTTTSAHQARMAGVGNGANGNITIYYQPTITADGQNRHGIEQLLKLSQREFEKMFQKMMQDRQRRAY